MITISTPTLMEPVWEKLLNQIGISYNKQELTGSKSIRKYVLNQQDFNLLMISKDMTNVITKISNQSYEFMGKPDIRWWIDEAT